LRKTLICAQEALLRQRVGLHPFFDQQQDHPEDPFLVLRMIVETTEGDRIRGDS